MPAPLRDHWVKEWTEEDIADSARQWRDAGGILDCNDFDIVDFVENVLAKRLKNRRLRIEFFDPGPGDDPAFVTYRPSDSPKVLEVILHIDPKVWKGAKKGNPRDRHVVAHEITHIIKHDNYAKAFSSDPSQNIKFDKKEHSAEWQANCFADYFLAPDHLVQRFADADSLARTCCVPRELAQERFSKIQRCKTVSYSGEICPNCSSVTLVRVGLLQKCNTCFVMSDEFGNILPEDWLL